MAHGDDREGLRSVYSALLGGLIASLLGILVFSFLDAPGPAGNSAPMTAMFIGIASVIVFMVGGVYCEGQVTWLAHTLLFASGFTAIWTAALSIGAEPRWAVAAVYVVTILFGIWLGVWRFGSDRPARPSGSEVTWTH